MKTMKPTSVFDFFPLGHYFVIEATMQNEKKLLCWQDKKHLYFATTGKGFAKPNPPTLFNTRKQALEAIKGVPSKGGNLKQFNEVIEANKVKVIKVKILSI